MHSFRNKEEMEDFMIDCMTKNLEESIKHLEGMRFIHLILMLICVEIEIQRQHKIKEFNKDFQEKYATVILNKDSFKTDIKISLLSFARSQTSLLNFLAIILQLKQFT